MKESMMDSMMQGWILLTCGLLLCVWCLTQMQNAIAVFFFDKRKYFLAEPNPKGTIRPILEKLALVLSEPSAKANRIQAVTSQLLRLRTWRLNWMWICFSQLSIIYFLMAGFLVFKIPGLTVAIVGVLCFLAANFYRPMRTIATAAIFLGLFLSLFEQLVQMRALLSSIQSSELIYLLLDGRGPASLFWAFFGLAVGFLLRLEGFAFVFGLLGVGIGCLSLNGAIMFWLGERAGMAMIFLPQSKKWPTAFRRVYLEYCVVLVMGVLASWLFVGILRNFILPGSGPLAELRDANLFWYLVLSILAEGPVLIALSAWGHWRGNQSPDDILEGSELGPTWFQRFGLRAPVLKVIRLAVLRRLDEIKKTREQFQEADWAKVPIAIRDASERQTQQLQRSLHDLEADLLSRSEFFDHQWL